jgi:outer membrane protein OmpA-like peptidoglycan-associated protein
MDEKDLHPLEVTVIYEKNNQKRGEFRTNAEGYFKVTLGEKGKYVFRSQMEGYFNLSDSLEINSYNPREGKTKDFYMTPIEVGITVRLNYIYFDFDKTSLTPESTPELDRVVNFLQQNSSIQVEIAGHTDNKGSDDYNLNLSQGRAQAVVDYLTDNGIDPGRLVAKGYGEGSPVATNDTEEGRQTNRRVEVKVIEK